MSKIAKNKNRINQRIGELEKQSAELRNDIESEFEFTKQKVYDIGKIVLGISGGLILSAIVLGRLVGRRGDKDAGKNLYGSRCGQGASGYQVFTLFITHICGYDKKIRV